MSLKVQGRSQRGGVGFRLLSLLAIVLIGAGSGCGEGPAEIEPDPDEPCEGNDCDEPCEGEDCEPSDPCEDVECDDPPPPGCEGESHLREYRAPGSCHDGECEYEFEEVFCFYGCDPDEDACRPCVDQCEAGESECREGFIRFCEVGEQGCLAWTDFTACEEGVCADEWSCGACDDQPCGLEDGCCPFGCTAENDPDCLPPTAEELATWVLLVADLHFGDSDTVHGDFSYFLDVVVPTIDAATVINAGDIVDLGTSIPDWEEYITIAEERAPPPPYYFEVPGNHDVKEAGITNYLSYTIAGRAGYGMYGQTFLEGRLHPYYGRLRVLRTNTADSGSNALNVPGIFTAEQDEALRALSPGDEPITYTLVAAHHPLTGLQGLYTGRQRMKDLVTHVGAAAYLSGHAHLPRLSWHEDTLVVQAVSLGKTNPPGFSLVSLDVSGPAAQMIDMTPRVPWPVVMIMAPADPDLGGENPHAVAFEPEADLEVRAIAFDPAGIIRLEAGLETGDWTSMARSEEGVWSTSLSLPADGDDYNLTVRAVGGSGTESQAMRVVVEAL